MKVLIFVIIPLVFSFSFKNITSVILDFVPGVSTVKGLYEAYSGKDMVTGEDLSNTDRALSLIGSIPFGNFLKNAKHLKNGQKFLKAAQRAKDAGKIKNAVKFAKAGARAMKKAEFVQKTLKYGTKIAKAVLKQTKENINNEENDEM